MLRTWFALSVALAFISITGVNAETIVNDESLSNEADTTNWLSYGRTYSEQRFSPLTSIDTD